MLYDAAMVVDGHAASRGKPPPRNHGARQNLAETPLPHICEPRECLYGAGMSARYCNGHAMAGDIRCECVRCHEAIMNSMSQTAPVAATDALKSRSTAAQKCGSRRRQGAAVPGALCHSWFSRRRFMSGGSQ